VLVIPLDNVSSPEARSAVDLWPDIEISKPIFLPHVLLAAIRTEELCRRDFLNILVCPLRASRSDVVGDLDFHLAVSLRVLPRIPSEP